MAASYNTHGKYLTYRLTCVYIALHVYTYSYVLYAVRYLGYMYCACSIIVHGVRSAVPLNTCDGYNPRHILLQKV